MPRCPGWYDRIRYTGTVIIVFLVCSRRMKSRAGTVLVAAAGLSVRLTFVRGYPRGLSTGWNISSRIASLSLPASERSFSQPGDASPHHLGLLPPFYHTGASYCQQKEGDILCKAGGREIRCPARVQRILFSTGTRSRTRYARRKHRGTQMRPAMAHLSTGATTSICSARLTAMIIGGWNM